MLRSIPLVLAFIASAAAAAPSGMSALPIGFAPGAHGGFGGGARFGAGLGHRPFPVPHRRHHFHHDREGAGALGYGEGVPVADEAPPVADGGFFSDGEAIPTRAGRVVYDYDRGYPYDYYRPLRPAAYEAPPPPALPARCVIERVPGGPVRICRR
jgi:hypothetical protein